MILLTGQGSQAKKLNNIKRQFLLENRDIAPDRLWRISWKA